MAWPEEPWTERVLGACKVGAGVIIWIVVFLVGVTALVAAARGLWLVFRRLWLA